MTYTPAQNENLKRNFFAMLAHGMLGQTGFRLIHAPTFLPAYIFLLSGSDIAVGVALALQHFGAALSSLWGGTLVEHRRKVLPLLLIIGAGIRVQIFLIAITGLILPPEYALVATFFFLLAFGFFNGMQAVTFHFIMSKLIPINVRGRLTGIRNMSAGIISSAVAVVGGTYFIETNALGNGYSATFLVAFVLTVMGMATLLGVTEPLSDNVREKTSLRGRIKDVPGLLREDKSFASFVLAKGLAALGMMAMPFYILYVGKQIGITGENLSILSAGFLLASTVSILLWGMLADKYGNRLVFLFGVLMWATSTISLVFAGDNILLLAVVFAGLGSGMGGFQSGGQNMVLEFDNTQDLPMRIAISNGANSIMFAVGPLMGGLLTLVAPNSTIF
jgi:MFS family permease